MKVHDALAAGLEAHGVRDVFGVMGEGNLELITRLGVGGATAYHAACHEAGAVGMADGYARAGGGTGVAAVTQGPGLANALTPLVAACRHRTPLVLIAADTPAGEATHPQCIDAEGIAAVAGASTVRLTEEVERGLSEAFERAAGGPVVLIAPTDVQRGEAVEGGRRARAADTLPPHPEAAAIEAAADLVSRSRRPVVLGGRGAVRAGAREALIALADEVGALLATSLQAKGYFGAHPAAIGVMGGFATETAAELLREADCVVALGASLNVWQTHDGALLEGTTVVHCDVDPRAIGAFAPADAAVVGDARLAAEALTAELRRRGANADGLRTAEVLARIAAGDAPAVPAADGRPLHPQLVVAALEDALPAERTLVVDGGHFTGFPCTGLSVPDPDGFLFMLDFGATGLGMAAAVGAGVARPGRRTLLVVGDGGLMMALAEIETAVRLGVPLVVVVMDDSAYGSEVHHMRARGLPDTRARFPQRPFAAVAAALGAEGMTVESADDLRALPDAVRGAAGPLLVDARIDGDVVADWFAAFARRTATSGRWT